MTTLKGTLRGHDDFELDLPRTHPVTYVAEVPKGPAEGLVFLVTGFGGDGQVSYQETLRRYICDKYNLVVVTVAAHCHNARPTNLNTESTESGVAFKFDLDSLFSSVGRLAIKGHTIDRDLKTDRDTLAFLKTFPDEHFQIKATMMPPWGEYQNFGVLAAMDHLGALGHIIDRGIEFDQKNIVCIGTSHGGYIAQIIHKFAPNTVSGIIEASSYNQAHPLFLGYGKELVAVDGNLSLALSTDTRWELDDVFSPNYLSRSREDIRHAAFTPHLDTITKATERRAQIRMIHSEADKVSAVAPKHRQEALLRSYGYDATLDVPQEADVDGTFIKSLDHGMGIAVNGLFDKYYPTLSPEPTVTDRERGTVLEFDCDDRIYRIEHLKEAPWIAASCPLKEDLVDTAPAIAEDRSLAG